MYTKPTNPKCNCMVRNQMCMLTGDIKVSKSEATLSRCVGMARKVLYKT